jgi:hypothetical protein
VLGSYCEPEVEPDVSALSTAAVRLRKRLAAALLMRARSAGNCTSAVSRCSAECAGTTATSPRPPEREHRSAVLGDLAMCMCLRCRTDHRERSPVALFALALFLEASHAAPAAGPGQSAQNRAGKVANHFSMPF